MRYIVTILCLFSYAVHAQTVTQPGLRDYQFSGATLPDSILYIMGTDTLDGSAKQGLGKWHSGEALRGFFKDTDWLRYRTMTTPSNTDTMYHASGPVIVGADTVILAGANGFGKAALNVGGLLDVRYPDYAGTNIVIGVNSLTAGSSTINNFLLGQGVMPSATGADYTIGIGNNALGAASTGDFNIGIGFSAFGAATGGGFASNVGLGYQVGATGTVASNNVLVGYQSGYNGNITAQNVLIGGQSGYGGCTSFNTIIGYQAGLSVPVSNNVFIGYQSGRLNTGSGNVFIGKESGENETGSNLLYIDNSNSATPLIGGDFAADTLRVNGDLSIRDAVSGASTDSVMVWTPSNGRVKMRNASAFGGATNLSIAQSGGTQVIQSSTGTDVGVRNLYGLLITEGATDTLHFRVDSSKIATQYDITQIPISSLKAAIATNTKDHANYAQEWQWNTLAGATGLKLSSTSTVAASNLHKLFEVSTTGANGSSGQSTYGAYFSNTHSGTTSTNYGLYSVATGAASANYGVYGTSNSSGVTGNVGAGVSGRNSNGGIAVEGITTSGGVGVYAESPDGYSVYSNTTNGTAGAFRSNYSDNSSYGSNIDFYRNTSNGANGANGIGGGLAFYTETSTGATPISNQIKSIWTTATNASRTSSMTFTGVNSGTEGDILILKGSKQIQIPGYGTGGTFTASPVADLFVDATGNVVQGSMTGQSWTADADDATTPTLISNQTLKIAGGSGITTDLFDNATTDSITVAVNGDKFTTVTTPEADDYMLMHDENGAGADVNEKILWSDLYSLISADGNGIYTGDGTTPSDVDVTVTDSLEFNGTLKIINDGNDYVGIGAQSPTAKLHVRGGSGNTMILEETGTLSTVDLTTKSVIDGVTSPFKLSVKNKDTGIDLTGDYYEMGNITFGKASGSLPGGTINFNIGYDSTNLDGILTLKSRESGATDGLVNVVGGLRYKWTSSASSTYTFNTGDYGLTMTTTGAKTATIPDAVSGIVGQELMIFNAGSSGDVTITITGGSGDTIYGDPILNINESAKIICVAANKWIVNN